MNCSYCNSDNIYFSKKKNLYICEDCGKELTEEKKLISKNLFLSYGHDPNFQEHIALAYRLRDDLKNSKHNVWFDEERLKPGYDWELFIENGLNELAQNKENSFLILLLTPYAVRRPNGYCLNEVAKALDLGIKIVPLMIHECKIPLSIYRIQWLDMRSCIPISEKAAIYSSCLERLINAIEENKIDFEGTQNRLLNVLNPIEFDADIFKLQKNFTGREWIIKEFENWIDNSNGRKIFWLLGDAGTGKSAISAWLRDHRQEVVAFHFCKINSKEKRNPIKLVLSLAYQLSTQFYEYQLRLAHLNLENIVKEYAEDAYTLFDKLIIQPFSKNYPDPKRIVVILIDALDESRDNYNTDNNMIDFLKLNVEETPSWMRFFITSRPEPELLSSLNSLEPFKLKTNNENNINDIKRYLKNQIANITNEQIDAIVKHSEGVFLYIISVCEEIKYGRLSLERLDGFPMGLCAFYEKYFKRYFEHNFEFYRIEIRKILYPIFASFEPLNIDFLLKYGGFENKDDLFDRLDKLGSLISKSGNTPKDTIKPYHRSIKDWITDNDKSGAYSIDISFGHKKLAEFGWIVFTEGFLQKDFYLHRFLPEHLLIIEDWDRLSVLLTDIDYLDNFIKGGKKHELMRYLMKISEYQSLREIFEKSINKLKVKNIKEDKLITFINEITQLLRGMGLLSDALPFAIQTVENLTMTLAPQNSKIGDALRDLAEVYRQLERYDDAFFNYNKALNIYRANYGENSSQVATIYHDFAEYYRDIGNYLEAIKCNKKALSIRETTKPVDLHALADCINDTGVLIWESKIQDEDVLHYYQKALDLFKTLYGDSHYDMAAVLGNIGNYHFNHIGKNLNGVQDRQLINLSLDYFEKSYKMMCMYRVKHHIDVNRVRKSLINCYEILDRIPEAIELQKENLRSAEILNGPDSLKTFQERQKLAFFSQKYGNNNLYLKLHLENFVLIKSYFKDNNSVITTHVKQEYCLFIRNLAYEYYENEMFNEAIEIYKFLVGNNFEIAGSCCHLARIYLITNKEIEARAVIAKASKLIAGEKLYVKVRILFFVILFGLLDGNDMENDINQIKQMLQVQEARLTWSIQSVIDTINPQLHENNLNLIQSLASLINNC